ncbi:hypothetical protein X760_30095 [Mesorhizobium sp. LSHC422A00]|uniref:hypothetical protein n=1 Tax=Mesorhizobium sp. LSHC422A00 TaxID=1287294 RepID=UPI0003CEA571|nr:hypothetical protein [Mesorhizobium sp. LSHC422A00]ESX53175.1 hypothetical protein X760_30095 [Mesorhizobium sp. LSHC422A00]
MNEFQAIPSSEIRRLRAASAEHFADLFLREAAGQIQELGGPAALQKWRERITDAVSTSSKVSNEQELIAALAIEELERAIQLARDGESNLRGWTEDAPPTVEELKP